MEHFSCLSDCIASRLNVQNFPSKVLYLLVIWREFFKDTGFIFPTMSTSLSKLSRCNSQYWVLHVWPNIPRLIDMTYCIATAPFAATNHYFSENHYFNQLGILQNKTKTNSLCGRFCWTRASLWTRVLCKKSGKSVQFLQNTISSLNFLKITKGTREKWLLFIAKH